VLGVYFMQIRMTSALVTPLLIVSHSLTLLPRDADEL